MPNAYDQLDTTLFYQALSAKHISESTISASLVVSNHLRLPAYLDDSISSLYGYVEDESYGDNSWRTLLKYHSYGVRDGGFLGFESEYVIDVLDDEVVLAKRSLYRRRDLKNVSVNKAEINVEIFERRTMADTALESRHVGRLEQRMKRLVSRAERS